MAIDLKAVFSQYVGSDLRIDRQNDPVVQNVKAEAAKHGLTVRFVPVGWESKFSNDHDPGRVTIKVSAYKYRYKIIDDFSIG